MSCRTLKPAPPPCCVDDMPFTCCTSPGYQGRTDRTIIVEPWRPTLEVAGPRQRLYFNPQETRAGIVTCGGLCPGLNNVIRSLVLELQHGYGVREILGFVDGYQGLDPWRGAEPLALTRDFVEDIHKEGGTKLNTSRGPVDELIISNVKATALASVKPVMAKGRLKAKRKYA